MCVFFAYLDFLDLVLVHNLFLFLPHSHTALRETLTLLTLYTIYIYYTYTLYILISIYIYLKKPFWLLATPCPPSSGLG